MRVILAFVVLAYSPYSDGVVIKPVRDRGPSYLEVDGKTVEVYWVDGDTVRFGKDDRAEMRWRLVSVNALESDASRHSLDGLSADALERLSREATNLAKSMTWKCHALHGRDTYGRGLIECPKLAEEGLRRGLYMPYDFPCAGVYRDKENPLAQALAEAQRGRQGIWRIVGKFPPYLVTAVHRNKGAWTVSAVEIQTGCVKQFPVALEGNRACITISCMRACDGSTC